MANDGGSLARNSRTARRAVVNRQKGGSSHMPSDDEILTVKELCDLLRLHPTTVYKLVRQGKIPRFRVGNEWRFRRDAIERWTVEQSMNAQRMRKVIGTGVNGEARHRRRAAVPGPKR